MLYQKTFYQMGGSLENSEIGISLLHTNNIIIQKTGVLIQLEGVAVDASNISMANK